MSCRRQIQGLPPRLRTGDGSDLASHPDLEHLATCPTCRREWEIERALGVQLQRALLDRVAAAGPSAISWQLVRQRALSADEDPDEVIGAIENPEETPEDRPRLASGWWTQPAAEDSEGRVAMSEWIVWSGRTPKFGL